MLAAVDKLDADAVMSLLGPQPRFLAADGRRAAGTDAVRELLGAFLATLRSTAHRITAQWHQGNVWIAEVEADYELQDWLELKALQRVFIARTDQSRVADIRVYGAHEHPLTEHPTGEEGMWIGTRWIPPL